MDPRKQRIMIGEGEEKSCYFWAVVWLLTIGPVSSHAPAYSLGASGMLIPLGLAAAIRGFYLGNEKQKQSDFKRFFGQYPTQIGDPDLQHQINLCLSELWRQVEEAKQGAKFCDRRFLHWMLQELSHHQQQFDRACLVAGHFDYRSDGWRSGSQVGEAEAFSAALSA